MEVAPLEFKSLVDRVLNALVFDAVLIWLGVVTATRTARLTCGCPTEACISGTQVRIIRLQLVKPRLPS